MKISRPSKEQVQLEDLNEWLIGFLEALPSLPEDDDERVNSRLFPDPSPEPAVCEEWADFVQPSLEEEFAGARQVVRSDLKNLEPSDDAKLIIPLAHAESWVNTLNQARLTLASRHEFTEDELSESAVPYVDDPRSILRFQMDLYALLQEVLIEALDQGDLA